MVISRTLRGASHEIWTLACAPPANVRVMNAVSGTLGLEDAAGRGRHLDDRLLQPVEQDREVVRREVQITPSGWYLPRFIRDEVTK